MPVRGTPAQRALSSAMAEKDVLDCAIIGVGPAGLTAALYLALSAPRHNLAAYFRHLPRKFDRLSRNFKCWGLYVKPASFVLAGVLAAFPAGAEACETGGQLQHPVEGEIYRKFGYTKDPLLKTVVCTPAWIIGEP